MLKKVISLVSALAMTLSVCSFVNVAQANGDPQADITFEVNNDIFNQEMYDAGYQNYTLTIYLETKGMGLTDNGETLPIKKKYTGSLVRAFSGKILCDLNKFYTDSSMITANTSEIKGALGVEAASAKDGIAFSWYTNDYTTALSGEKIEIGKVQFWGCDAEYTPTMTAEDDYKSCFSIDTTNAIPSVTYAHWEDLAASKLTVDDQYLRVLTANENVGNWYGYLGISEEATLSSIAVDKTAIEVAGGATYDLAQIVTTATYSDDTTAEVTPVWSGNGVSGTTFTAPAAPAYGEDDLTITLTATYEGETATVTVTVPASTVAPEFSAEATALSSYYTADSAEFSRKKVTMFNRVASKLALEFVDAAGEKATKTFEVELPVTGGEATNVFEAWVMNAPATWTINVAEVQ